MRIARQRRHLHFKRARRSRKDQPLLHRFAALEHGREQFEQRTVARHLHQRRARRDRQRQPHRFRKRPIDEGDVHQRIHRHHAFHHAAQDGLKARALPLQGLHHHADAARGHFQSRRQPRQTAR